MVIKTIPPRTVPLFRLFRHRPLSAPARNINFSSPARAIIEKGKYVILLSFPSAITWDACSFARQNYARCKFRCNTHPRERSLTDSSLCLANSSITKRSNFRVAERVRNEAISISFESKQPVVYDRIGSPMNLGNSSECIRQCCDRKDCVRLLDTSESPNRKEREFHRINLLTIFNITRKILCMRYILIKRRKLLDYIKKNNIFSIILCNLGKTSVLVSVVFASLNKFPPFKKFGTYTRCQYFLQENILIKREFGHGVGMITNFLIRGPCLTSKPSTR